MREIKFRAFVISGNYTEILPNVQNHIGNRDSFGHLLKGVTECYDEVHVMQYTGLRDKNGVEIYEGDIVKHSRVLSFPCCHYTGEPNESDGRYERFGHITITASKGVVINGLQSFEPDDGSEIKSRKYNENPGSWSDCAEVIGNIHEDKRLIDNK